MIARGTLISGNKHIWSHNWLVMLPHGRNMTLQWLLTKSQPFLANMVPQQQLRPSTVRSLGTPWRPLGLSNQHTEVQQMYMSVCV